MHYNRHRYYDPGSGRFISKDPIGLAGGINVYQYAPNPVGWVDPLGLARCPCDCEKMAERMAQSRKHLRMVITVDVHAELTHLRL
nr:RHS repeat-associated core domain-containing protein [Burkholderia vietnamiensis]